MFQLEGTCAALKFAALFYHMYLRPSRRRRRRRRRLRRRRPWRRSRWRDVHAPAQNVLYTTSKPALMKKMIYEPYGNLFGKHVWRFHCAWLRCAHIVTHTRTHTHFFNVKCASAESRNSKQKKKNKNWCWQWAGLWGTVTSCFVSTRQRHVGPV